MYFSNFQTVNQIKQEYRRLALIHHPDRGGDTATMQQINAEYQEALARCDGQTTKGTDGKDHTYYYNPEVEQAIMDKIHEILALRLPNIDIWLIGTWVWVDGDTYPVKDKLNAIKMRWHSKRKKWYWKLGKSRSRYNKNASFTDLAMIYGAKKFQSEEREPAGALA